MRKGVYAVKIPKGEIAWFTRYEEGKPKYVITSKQLRDWYYIYEVNGGELKKLGRARTPPELEEKYIR